MTRKNDREAARKRAAAWRAANPDKVRAASLAWYRRNAAKANARTKAWRRANPDKTRRRVAANRAIVDELKSRPCMDCGGQFPPVCMDFDHRPGETKVNNVGSLCSGFNLQAVLAEIAKCDLVCSNCHRIRTFNRRKK